MGTYKTHKGRIHADEVGGYVVAKRAGLVHRFERIGKDDPETFEKGDFYADIKRRYDPVHGCIDHHQWNKDDPTQDQSIYVRPNGLPYATCGMFWRLWGEDICGDPEVAERVERTFIQQLDANDADSNFQVKVHSSAGHIPVMNLSRVISDFNYFDITNHEEQHKAFQDASELLDRLLVKAIDKAETFITNRDEFSRIASYHNRVVLLREGFAWKELVEIHYPDALYVVSPSNHPNNPFQVQSVPVVFYERPIKKEIQRPEWFTNFIHAGKYIAGCETQKEALELAYYNVSV